MDQEIRFCTTSDGVGIAYATLGSGPPLVYVSGWFGNLATEWEKALSRDFLVALADGFTLVRYDMRGSGLSDRNASGFSLDALVKDLEAVVGQAGTGPVPLLCLGLLAGPIAMTYAAEHPERVSHLVLSSAYLRGDRITTPERQQALIDYVKAFGRLAVPEELDQVRFDPEKLREAREIVQKAAPANAQAELLRTMFSVDVTEAAARLSMPTLILHGREDFYVPFELGRALAARLPHARFVPHGGSGSAPWAEADFLLPEIHSFLRGEPRAQAARAPAAAPSGLVTLLFTDMEGSTNLTQRLGDAKAQEMVRAHNTIVRDALTAHGGSEIKHTGDGIMASFPSASRALECALAIQRAVAGQNRDVGAALAPPRGAASSAATGAIRLRIGLNAGEPVAEEEDLFGAAVQLAARVCAHAQPGQVLVSNVVRELAMGKGFLFSDVGEVELRGFEDPVRLYEVRWQPDTAGEET